MPYYLNNMETSPPPQVSRMSINTFMGINLSINAGQLHETESPDMLNMLSDDKGALDGRPGHKTLLNNDGDPNSLVLGPVRGLLHYRKAGEDIYLLAHGTALYRITDIAADPLTLTTVHSGMSGNRVRGFTYRDKFYMLDGSTYWVYDGVSVTSVEPFVPILTISTPPGGGGEPFQSLNLLGSGFRQQFNGDGTSTVYQLAFKGADLQTENHVAVTVDGQVETNFTYQQADGTITFASAPAAGLSNVDIKAYRSSNRATDITDCTFAIAWGGSEGNRIYLSGNPNNPNQDYRSGLADPTYFPDDGIGVLGSTGSSITGYSTLYDRLVIFKENAIYTRHMDINGGDPQFYDALLNGSIGTVATDSIAILDNFPTFLSTKGVYQVISIDASNEENVRCVSTKINKNSQSNVLSVKGILEMGSLRDYQGIDHDKKYWLFHPTLQYAWVFDYESESATAGAWFRLDGINPSCLLEVGDKLLWGLNDYRQICRFKDPETENTFFDESPAGMTAIDRYWTSKYFDFGAFSHHKGVSVIFTTLRPQSRARADIYTRGNDGEGWKRVKAITRSLFNYATLSYSEFSYGGNLFPIAQKIKVNENKLTYYQVRIACDSIYNALGFTNLAINYMVQQEI